MIEQGGTSVASAPVLERLGALCLARGLDGLSGRLHALAELGAPDLAVVEKSLGELPWGRDHVTRCAGHLLDLGGKRLRPLCVALAARTGSGFGPEARDLAVAVELVHAATLLHDDVVDLGDVRRGGPAARMVYGNAASIFAGDWLLVEALRRVRAAGIDGLFDGLLEVIHEMICAEALQLERRGHITADRAAYFRVVEGKTAALFRWALLAGGRAGGLGDPECRALERYGLHLGVAFQLVDDLLDLTGDPAATGKALFADFKEGKMTYPLLVTLEREPGARAAIEALLAAGEAGDPAAVEPLVQAARRTGALDEGRALARARAEEAAGCLERLPPSPARAALEAVAAAAVARER